MSEPHAEETFLRGMSREFFLSNLLINPHDKNNILELVLCIYENIVKEIEVGGKLGNSDHEYI